MTARKQRLRWSLGLLVSCVLAAGCALETPDPGSQTHLFESGRFRLDPAEKPPPETAAWEPVTLTDVWRESRPEAHGRGWYRFRFALDATPDERWAVFLPGVASNAAVFVNGAFVGDGGRMEEPVTLNSNRPLFFPFSAGLLEAGENRLDVALFAHRGSWDRLEPVYIGPAAALAPSHRQQRFWHVTLAELASGVGVALSLFLGIIWLAARRDPLYGFFLLTAAAWVVGSFNYHVREVPVSFWTWERIVHGSFAIGAVSSAFAVHRLLGMRRPRVEAALLAWGAVVLLLFLTLREAAFTDFVQWAGLSHVLVVGYGAFAIGRHRRLLEQRELPVFLAAAATFVVIAAHDLAIQSGWVEMEAMRLLPLAGPVILLAFATTLGARFIRAYDLAESLNAELEERVRSKQAELERNYGRLSQLERERALSLERERIVREVHDGMGGKIVSSLALLETGPEHGERVIRTLRESLDDMRLLIRSLDPEDAELGALLGGIRERIDARLEGHALTLEWKVGDLPEQPLSPEASLHLLRIVEEAITNVLKHAQASTVRVATEEGEGGVVLSIRDDGSGPGADSHSGRGLEHMRARARALGGRLHVEGSATGTEVRLWIPSGGGPAAP